MLNVSFAASAAPLVSTDVLAVTFQWLGHICASEATFYFISYMYIILV